MSSGLCTKFTVKVRDVRGTLAKMVVRVPGDRKFSTRSKVIVEKPVVEIGGDEMSKVIFNKVKQKLIIPFVNLERDYYDLSLANRNRTENEITLEAIESIKKYKVAIKAATIIPNAKIIKEQKLKQIIFPNPNVTIRKAIGGTQFREPIICSGVGKSAPCWTKPVIICRHIFGDKHNGQDIVLNQPGKVTLVYTSDAGETSQYEFDVRDKGVAMLSYNTIDSIRSFAESCFETALSRKYPLYFTSKDTNLRKYDTIFAEVFQELYDKKYNKRFKAADLTYEHRLMEEMTAHAIKSNGGFIWALKCYDGDILSDIVGQGFGSTGMMMNSLLSHDEKTIVTEPAHGTITRHYKRHLKERPTSTNPISTIFAWTNGLKHRAKLDGNYDLLDFVRILEQCSKQTVEEGHLTRDLALNAHGHNFCDSGCISTDDFIDIIAEKLEVLFEQQFGEEEAEVVL